MWRSCRKNNMPRLTYKSNGGQELTISLASDYGFTASLLVYVSTLDLQDSIRDFYRRRGLTEVYVGGDHIVYDLQHRMDMQLICLVRKPLKQPQKPIVLAK